VTVAWLCESVRLTALWGTPDDVSKLLTWNAIIGSDPEQQETQPRIHTVREVGAIWDGSASLEFRASPGRADWIVAPVIPADIQLATWPNLGRVEEIAERFSEFIFGAVARVYSAPRFAFGLIALHPQPSREASYAELTNLLRISSLQREGASDFVYQINRARPSKSVPGLSINRVSRWASVVSQGLRMQFSMSPVGVADGAVASTQTPPTHATRAELDMNTAADRRDPIPATGRAPLLRELAGLSLELLETGDVP